MANISTRAKHLAKALVLIAQANNYLVGLHSSQISQFSEEDIWQARDIIIDLENADKLSENKASVALEVLAATFGKEYRA